MVVAANKSDLLQGEGGSKGREETSAKVEQEQEHEQEQEQRNKTFQVRKSWKLAHQECSARHNWNISVVFRELAR